MDFIGSLVSLVDFAFFPFHEEERGNRGVIIIVVSIFELFFSLHCVLVS